MVVASSAKRVGLMGYQGRVDRSVFEVSSVQDAVPFAPVETKMEVHAEKRVRANILSVFEVFADVRKIEARIPGILKVELLSEGPVGPGFRWRETRKMMGKEATEEMWFDEFDPPRRYTVKAHSHGTQYLSVYDFEAAGDETVVHMTFSAEPETLGAKILAALLGWMGKGTVKKMLEADMDALATHVESQS